MLSFYNYASVLSFHALISHITHEFFRSAQQCSFVEHRNYKIVYRRYASLFFLVGVDNDEVSI